MSFKTILLGVIIVVILYLVWKYVFADNTNQSLSMGGNAKNKQTILASSLPLEIQPLLISLFPYGFM